jgi:hypothetical protein
VPDPEYPMATVRKDDLDVLLVACLQYLPGDPDPDIRTAFARLHGARGEDADPETGPEPAGEPPLPDGFYGRVEIPGMRNHTGWVTEETRFGQQLAVVRDWNGAVVAEMGIGPACRVLHLPTPLKRPGPAAAITAGGWAAPDGDYDPDEDPAEDDGASWERGD